MEAPRTPFSGSIGASVPTGWFAKESITLLAPDGQANVIVSSEPLAPSIDTTRYAEVQGELLRKEFPGYIEHWYGPRPLMGLEGYLRSFSWTPPDGVEVTQLQAYAVGSGRGYTATGTSPSNQTHRFHALFVEMLDSLERRA